MLRRQRSRVKGDGRLRKYWTLLTHCGGSGCRNP
jgi:hypothetical protein